MLRIENNLRGLHSDSRQEQSPRFDSQYSLCALMLNFRPNFNDIWELGKKGDEIFVFPQQVFDVYSAPPTKKRFDLHIKWCFNIVLKTSLSSFSLPVNIWKFNGMNTMPNINDTSYIKATKK